MKGARSKKLKDVVEQESLTQKEMSDQFDAMLLTEIKKIKRVVVPFEKLMLDPNNPRLATADKLKKTATNFVSSPEVQSRTAEKMWQMNGRATKDLLSKISREGLIWSLTTFHVALLPDGNYILNDGNSRVTATRELLRKNQSGEEVYPDEVIDSTKEVTVAVLGNYGDCDYLWNLMRAKLHIAGNKSWGSFQRARFVVELRDSGDYSNDQIKKLSGLRDSSSIKKILDCWHAFQIAREDESYGLRIKEKHFAIFGEAISGGSSVKNYLGWVSDGTSREFTNRAHMRQLLHLMAPPKGRAWITSNTQVKLRVLGGDPNLWDKAVNATPSNTRFLSTLVGIESGKKVSGMAQDLYARLKNMKLEEIQDIDIGMIRSLRDKCASIVSTHEKLVAA